MSDWSADVGSSDLVVSRLRTATPLQVNLQVKISEVSRNLLHKIGTNFTSIDRSGGKVLGSIGSGNRDFASFDVDKNLWTFNNPADGSTTLGGVARILGMDVAGALDLAETTGLATTLAQPNMTCLSGETARFLAGGEYPNSVSYELTGKSQQFQQTRVRL